MFGGPCSPNVPAMPYYEYHCPENGRVVEVRHGMSETLATWAQVCARAGEDAGSTPGGAPVERIMSVPAPTASSGPGPAAPPGCGHGCACAMDT